MIASSKSKYSGRTIVSNADLAAILIITLSILVRIYLVGDAYYGGHAASIYDPALSLVKDMKFPASFGAIGDLGIPYGPALVYLFAPFLMLWQSVYMLYAFSFLMWAIASYLIYLIGKEFFSEQAGLFACAFTSFHLLPIISSLDCSNGSFTAAFSAAILYSMYRIRLRNDMASWLILFTSAGFLMHIHISSFVSLPMIAAFLLLRPNIKNRFFCAGVIILVLFLVPYAWYLAQNSFSLESILSQTADAVKNNKPGFLSVDPRLFQGVQLLYLLLLLASVSAILFHVIRHRKNPEALSYFIALVFFLSALFWISLFPYLFFYSFSFLFGASALLAAEFLSILARHLNKKILYLAVSVFIVSGVLYTVGFIRSERERGMTYNRLEIKASESLLQHNSGNMCNGNEESIVIYTNPHLGVLMRSILREKGYCFAKNRNILLIPEKMLPIMEIESSHLEKIDSYRLIILNNSIIPRMSEAYETGWSLQEFNDTSWKALEMPVRPCSENCIHYWPYEDIPEEDIYLRFGVEHKGGGKAMLVSSHNRIFITEIRVNGDIIYEQSSEYASVFNNTFEIQIDRYLKPGDNIVGMHIKHKRNVADIFYFIILDGN